MTEEEQLERLEINARSSSDSNEEVGQVQTSGRQVTVIDKQSKEIKAVIVLEGDISSFNNDLSVALELLLREFSGDTIRITAIEEGSIRLTVEGSQEDIKRLVSRIRSGELTELSGFPIEDIQILSGSSDDENNELDDKWRLVQEIVSQAVEGRNLSGADLSDANLSGVDLSDADLSGADLSGADLSNANLRRAILHRADLSRADLSRAILSNAYLSGAILHRADLHRADLSGAILHPADLSRTILHRADLSGAILFFVNLSDANLSDANLSRANLSRANLSRANLSEANVEQARFDDNTGLSESEKLDLKRRGAIFDDSPGDRSESLIS